MAVKNLLKYLEIPSNFIKKKIYTIKNTIEIGLLRFKEY